MEISQFIIQHVDLIAEFISFLIALKAYPYLKHSFMRWFPPFLGFIFLSETIGGIGLLGFHTTYLSFIIQAAFYGHIFSAMATVRITRLVIRTLAVVGMSAYVFSYFFLDTTRWFMFGFTKITLIFDFFLVGVGLNYLYCRAASENKTIFHRDSGVWISLGVVIFYSGFSFVVALYPYIIHMNLRLLGVRLYHLIPRLLSVVLYSCLTVSIIQYWRAKEKKEIPLNSLTTL